MTRNRGLTLGKFAPLHKGHQHLIETALSEMDEVLAIIYDCPELTPVPLNVRANWIRSLYPAVTVLEAWDGPVEVGDSQEIKKRHEDYVLKHLKPGEITHFYSSEFYGEHMSQALGAVNRILDPRRETIPISATTIREDPFAFREYLHPRVYRDLVTNVVFIGAPATGKTTIAARLAKEYKTVWMPEEGREYWHEHQVNRRLSLAQLEEIAERHLQREEDLLGQANRFLFTDTNALTTNMFAISYHSSTTNRLKELADQAALRYDLVFLCDTDITYDDTWDRSGDVRRHTFQKQIVADLIVRKYPFVVLRGSLEVRVQQARTILDRYQKYTNILDLFGSRNE
jgi:HTH-type transcriptional regulator, transcriptional repressor of NAD biosynthesis genes